LKKKLQSVAIFKKTPIFVMRRCSSAYCITLKKFLRLAADMKKTGIYFQVFSFVSALYAVVKNFSSAFNFPNRNGQSSLAGIYHHLIIKTGVS